MSDVVIATNSRDAGVGPRMEAHHAELIGGLTMRIDAVIHAAESGTSADLTDLADYARRIGAHLDSAEASTIAAAGSLPDIAPVATTISENVSAVRSHVAATVAATSAVRAAAAGGKLLAGFSTHVSLTDEYLIPALAASTHVALADIVDDNPDLIGDGDAPAAEHVCECGVVDSPDLPELDARSVPHAIRHATIFGALDAVKPGGGMILVAPHDPLPLLDQLEQRSPGRFAIDYVERGPEAWRLQFVRIHD